MNKLLGLLTIFTLLTFSTTSFAGFEGLNSGVSLKIFNRIDCTTGLTCSRGKSGKFVMAASGFGSLQNQVVATATTISSSQCGSTFVNAGAIQMELPEVSTVLGCRLTFVVDNASNFDVNPDDADIILVTTQVAGDAMRNATLGGSITIEAISATHWMVISSNGTWTDIN